MSVEAWLLGGAFAAAAASSLRTRAIPGFVMDSRGSTAAANNAKGHPLGQPFSLADAGNWTRRRDSVVMVIVHLGGNDAPNLFAYMDAEGRPSTHVSVDLNGWWQFLPGDVTAYQTAGLNSRSIGVDLSQPWESHELARARGLGYQVKRKRLPYAPGECLTIDPRVLRAASTIIASLLWSYGLGAPRMPSADDYRHHDQADALKRWNVVCHAHVDPDRVDAWCWWPELHAAMPEAYKLIQAIAPGRRLVAG